MTKSLQVPTSTVAGQETNSREVDFFSLPRPIQDRVVASLSGQGVPAIIAYQPPSAWRAQRFLVAAGICLVALLALARFGYGNLNSAWALHPFWLGACYLILGGIAGACIAAYLRARSQSPYPFSLGRYLFPVGVIEVTQKGLRTTSLTQLKQVTAEGNNRVRLEMASATFRFPLSSGYTAEQLRAEVEEHRARVGDALVAGDRRTLAGLDPVRDSGFSNPLSSRAPLSRPSNTGSLRFLAMVSGGAIVAGLFFWARNSLAERSIYRQAVEQNTQASYQAYLARGGRRADVRDVRLPQTELVAASGDLAAVEKYAADHPNSKIRESIDAMLRLELLKELRRARAESDLAAIESFKSKHSGYLVVEQELAQARREVFDEAIKQFKKTYSPSDEVLQFVTALTKYSELHGPSVEVRFQRTLPPSIERADSAIRRSAYFTGSKAVPSRYFKGEPAEEREARATQALVGALQSAFSPSILQFVAIAGSEGEASTQDLKKPALIVNYKTEMSGGYTTNRPRGVYVGLGMMFQSEWVIPGQESSLKFKDSSWLPPDINEISRNSMTHEQVYEKNAKEGFERFVRRFVERVLGEKAAREVAMAEKQ